MLEDVADILIPPEAIKKRVAELAEAISRDYRGKELLLIGVLKGSLFFLADLLRKISIPVTLDFIGTSSYGEATSSTGIVKITKDLEEDIENIHVLLVEDIVDTGLTLDYLIHTLRLRKPADIKVCSLLDKTANRRVEIPIAYRGFDAPDEFLVGYGLDFRDQYRHLPFVCTLKSDVIERRKVKK